MKIDIEKIAGKKGALIFGGLFICCTLLLFFQKPHLFNDPYSSVLFDRNNKLMGAHIAEDGQWRFPGTDTVPEKFRQCILQFEDKQFYKHFGLDILALHRAIFQNIKAGKIVSGGSTITMQTIRLSRKGKPRILSEKIIEMLLAIHLEMHLSKKEILALYASHAPFGGNVVGLEAASWRYFGRSPENLSWAEAATLAVLPNAPSLIFPGKNRELLIQKRNRLLDKLYENAIIDSMNCSLSKLEEIPEKPSALPSYAPHVLDYILKNNRGERFVSTLDLLTQKASSKIVSDHHKLLEIIQIHNVSAIIADVETGDVLAYIGNTTPLNNELHANSVDVCRAARSTGSIMKPYLYALMLDEGEILPNTLVPDIPTFMSGYSPKNFDLEYQGMVPAKQALAKSLNIPAVRMLHQYGIEKFHFMVNEMGLTTINKPPSHYGLTLILGGAEANLWDLTGVYASMSRTLKHFRTYNSKYNPDDFRPLNIEKSKSYSKDIIYNELSENSLVSAAAIWLTYEALLEVNRPDEESGWENFTSAGNIAWKTGTSFGFRDAWAIGTNTQYVIGVWVGNADGEGRPGITGRSAAAPVLFDLFRLLNSGNWFDTPYDELIPVVVCSNSGHKASEYCTETDTIWVHESGVKTLPCPYHKLIHLDKSGQYQVHAQCESVYEMIHKSFFVLPPVQEWYYKQKHHDYKNLPPFREDCIDHAFDKGIEFIYPEPGSIMYLPTEIDGTPAKFVAVAAVRKPENMLYWHLDNNYLGKTDYVHQMELRPSKGKHVLTIVDEYGSEALVHFEIVN